MEENKDVCPCRNCERAATCNWTCDALNDWAEDKSFAQIADEFIGAYNRAEKEKHRRQRKQA